MNALVAALLDELDEEALTELAVRLAPFMPAPASNPTPAPLLLTAAEVAERASVHPETVRRAIREERLPVAGRVGRSPRIAPDDVDAWLGASRPARPASTTRRPRGRTGSTLRDAMDASSRQAGRT